MDSDQNEQRLRLMRIALEEKDTDELLTIWKKNDRNEWTDEAFETIRQILLDRIGSLPLQDDAMVEEVYHDIDRLTHVSSVAKALSSLFLIVTVGLVVYLLISILSTPTRLDLNALVAVLLSLSIVGLLGSFFYVALQGIAEVIWVLLDIEDNTRRAATRQSNQRE